MAKEAVVPSSAATTVYNSSIHTKRKRTHFSLLLSLRYVSASSSAMSTSKSSLLGTIGIGQTRYYSGDEANSKKKCTVLRTRAVLAVEMVQSRRRMATHTFVQVSLHSVHDEEENWKREGRKKRF